MNKLSKELFYYLGRDSAHNLLATKAGSLLVTGEVGRGKSIFIDNLVTRVMLESNPRDVDIAIVGYDISFLSYNSGVPEDKYNPYISKIMSYLEKDLNENTNKEFIEEVLCFLEEVKNTIDMRSANPKEVYESKIIILDCSSHLFQICEDFGIVDRLVSLLRYILSHGYLAGVHLVLTEQSSYYPDKYRLTEMFPIKVCFCRSDVRTSLSLMGNKVAVGSEERNGCAWVRVGNMTPYKIYVPFFPDTWMKKFFRVFSVYKNTDNSEL